MIDIFYPDYLKNNPDYPLHPCNFNLRPDKMFMFKLGITTSPEGWGCGGYISGKYEYIDWLTVGWTIFRTPEKSVSFWLKALSKTGESFKKRHTYFPNPPVADAFWLEIVDWDGPQSMGWGKEFKQTCVITIDDVFAWIKDQPRLREFFFTEHEAQNLKLNDYDLDDSRRKAWKPPILSNKS